MSALPREVLDMHVGILGKTGSGKSNLAKVTVEALLDEGARVCVIDPTGTWYGLRLTRAGKPSAYQPVIFGGQHADIAIGRTHGAAVAETIGTSSTPAIIDTRTMPGGGSTGHLAQDANGDWLWSVRWPAHECYLVNEKPHCSTGTVPSSFRSGKAPSEAKARRAIDDAVQLGRPSRDTTERQFVRA